ncbi:PDDEXK nuclease domain-containing protein [Desulfococcaceae bacterium HSG8]|nr:PDDEXK nuclease domain-containing protein [Desulfococcaceae bacterium HSG8]
MNKPLKKDKAYSAWLKELKDRVRQVQIKAAVKVNSELLQFYWNLGQDIVEKQKNARWGSGFLKQLSMDMSSEFPDMKGFSERNIKYVRQWFLFYNRNNAIGQQAVAQLTQIPGGIILSSLPNDIVVEYALKDIRKPIGVSEYMITKNLPDEFKSSLPSIEEIETELNGSEK